MRLLLLSTYELGHQPLHIASPAAALRDAGHDVQVADLAQSGLASHLIEWADAAAISVPMHTAARLARSAVQTLRSIHPAMPVCLYGLYANVGAMPADAVRRIAGEYEAELVEWAGDSSSTATTSPLGRQRFVLPDRTDLPVLDEYARFRSGDEERLVGYVEASHGCRHRCRHCPLPVVYDGTYRIVGEKVVLADIDQLVAAGATHISFGDPDFLNGPRHSLRIAEALHERHPGVTFDVTVKVEHILAHREVWPALAKQGLAFVVSAFETTNDHILTLLDKGHTAADGAAAVHLLHEHGLTVRPTWLPFTPWTGLDDLADIVDFLDTHELDVDPVQLSIRLLIPDGSLVLELPELVPHLGEYDSEMLGWTWQAADPAVDELAERLGALAGLGVDRPPREVYADMRREILAAAGRAAGPIGSPRPGPRLTEPWFC